MSLTQKRAKRKRSEDPGCSGESLCELNGKKFKFAMKQKDEKLVTQPRAPSEWKVFMDPVHGLIELHPLCVKIIDTPQFQRLRNIKQLGAGYYVYPGASHNRFEHSLGVCHLAGQLVQKLRHRQKELKINDVDVLSVMIAGLCHDLGHGPFSHMFDAMFIPKAKRGSKWKHETGSTKMFDYLIKENGLKPEFKKYGLLQRDIVFIKELIEGPRSRNGCYRGRDQDKHFLYEVVSNKRNSVDVDKWDYLARDCHHLGIKNSFDHNRFMANARVLDVGSTKQICSRDKEDHDIYDLFHTRQRLYRKAGQHKIVKIIEYMLTEALLKADKHLLTEGTDGRMLKISDTIKDMKAYTKMTDYVIQRILDSSDQELEESKKIIHKIHKRELYKCVGQTKPKKSKHFNKADTALFEKEIAKKSTGHLRVKDIIVMPLSLDYCKQEENPIDQTCFYMKNKPTVAIHIRKEQVSRMLPEHFRDQQLYVFCKKLDQQSLDVAKNCFFHRCLTRDDLEEPKGGDVASTVNTPTKQTRRKRPVSYTKGRARRKLEM